MPLALSGAMMSLALSQPAQAQSLESFAILAGQSVTNTGPTTITGNIGISPGDTITGAGSITLTGTIYAGNAAALQAQNDLTTLYNFLSAQPTSPGGDLTGQDLGTLTPLTPGVYSFSSSAALNGTLVLDAQGDPDAVFIFNIGSTLTTGAGSSVVLINGAQGGNVFFVVGSSATLFTSTSFAGQIVALTSITLQTTASIQCGAALARNGSVTLDTNTISICVLAGEFGDVLDEGDIPDDSNAQAVADALDAFIAAFGALPPGFAILAATLTPEQLAAALAQLAGEGGSGVAFAVTDGTDSFTSLAFGDRAGRGISVSPGDDGPMQDDNTISAMGYWPTGVGVTGTDAFGELLNGPSRSWDLWLAPYGGFSLTLGDTATGAHDRASLDYGLAGGIDFLLRPGTELGVAIGWGGNQFALAEGMGSGGADTLQIGIHSRTENETGYLEGGLAYGYSAVTTNRQVTIAGLDEFRGEFGAHTVTAEVEAGYNMEWLTPYAAVRGQAYLAPAYSESTVTGVSTYALDYAAQTMLTARTEIGVRMEWTDELDDGSEFSFNTNAAWAHEFRTGDTIDASFQALGPVSTFTIQGARPAADALILGADLAMAYDNGFEIGASADGEFTWNAFSYGGSLTLSRTW